MYFCFLQNEATAARRRIPIYLVDVDDGITPKTGLTFAAGDAKIDKDGGGEANHGGTFTELATGSYYYEATQGELDTLGYWTLKIVKTGVRVYIALGQVIATNVYDSVRLGLTALPNAAAEAAGGLITRGTGTGQLNVSTGKADAQVKGIDAGLLFVKKNVAFNNFEFVMYDSTDHVTPKTGLTVTAERSIDGAAFAACANSATEVGNGVYKINLATTDLNGDMITFRFTSAGADAMLVSMVTQS